MDTEEDDLFRCAICGTAEGDASNLSSQTSLQTNATVRCGHQFCNSCLDRELARKREFPCPICNTAVKRVNLTSRSLDHVQCEKDTSWRRRILSVFNRTEKGKSSERSSCGLWAMFVSKLHAVSSNRRDVSLAYKKIFRIS